MDIFQFIGDILHLLAIFTLIRKILWSRNVLGISYKTQEIYTVVFLSRYVDIFMGWKTFYFFIMKIVLIFGTMYTAYLIRMKKPFMLTYNASEDSFPHYYLYAAAAIFTMIIHKSFLPYELIWSYSIWLEALAILPQLSVIMKSGEVQNFTANYVLYLGLYRIFYVFHWLYNWQKVVMTSFIAGLLQSILYADFIYYFFKSKKSPDGSFGL